MNKFLHFNFISKQHTKSEMHHSQCCPPACLQHCDAMQRSHVQAKLYERSARLSNQKSLSAALLRRFSGPSSVSTSGAAVPPTLLPPPPAFARSRALALPVARRAALPGRGPVPPFAGLPGVGLEAEGANVTLPLPPPASPPPPAPTSPEAPLARLSLLRPLMPAPSSSAATASRCRSSAAAAARRCRMGAAAATQPGQRFGAPCS
jgi:hypothetical protein